MPGADAGPAVGIDLELINGRLSDGWTGAFQLIGSLDSLMVIHFRKTLEEIKEAQRFSDMLRASHLELSYSFLSVTEAGLYHVTAQLAAEAEKRGGKVGDDAYRAQMNERIAAELSSDHMKRRLFPPLPKDMPYVCFYPMSKRRDAGQNWYTLSLDES
jgi:chlorite dismutase